MESMTQILKIEVLKDTAQNIEELSRDLGISPGEVVDRLALQACFDTPLKAAVVSLEEIVIITQNQDKAQFLKTIGMIMAVLGDTFIQLDQISKDTFWRFLEEQIDKLSSHMKEKDVFTPH